MHLFISPTRSINRKLKLSMINKKKVTDNKAQSQSPFSYKQ